MITDRSSSTNTTITNEQSDWKWNKYWLQYIYISYKLYYINFNQDL